MPEPTTPERDQFLQRIAARLPFAEAEKLDILRELAGHLADSTSRFEAQGLSGAAAEQAALDQLGPPDRLADELAEARHSPGRLLVAAGAGTWAAIGAVVYGYLFTVLALVGASLATLVVVGSLHLFTGASAGVPDLTTITLVALGVGAYVAGQRMTLTVAGRAGYHVRLVRRATALFGGVLVLAYALVGWKGTLTWPEVGLLLSLPAWFVIGAWRASEVQFPSRRWRLRVVGLAVIAVPMALLLGLNQPGNGAGSGGFHPAGVDRIGLPTPDAIVAATESAGFGGMTTGGTSRIWIGVGDPAALAGWTDFRVEAWRAIRLPGLDPDPDFGIAVDPGATAPFAIGPARLGVGQDPLDAGSTDESVPDGATQLSGSVTIDRSPSVTLAWVAITGVAPDGHRYILQGPSYESTAFNGTGLDWLAAVASGR